MVAPAPDMPPPLVEICGVSRHYRAGETAVSALRDVSLRIEDGEFVAIMGPSGSGKSTLMHILGLLDRPSSGRYLFGGREVGGLDRNTAADVRNREIGFVFQTFHLLARYDALANVELPLIYARVPRRQRRRRAAEALAQVGLADRLDHRPLELSGGEQQRVAIARALVGDPRLILADEPTGSLDSDTGRGILTFLRDLNRTGRTIVVVTHDLTVAGYARRRIAMRDGRIEGNATDPASTAGQQDFAASDTAPATVSATPM